MTEEQIAELESIVDARRRDFPSTAEQRQMCDALPRLLEERKRLLAGLRRARRCCALSACREAADGTIAFAEETAP